MKSPAIWPVLKLVVSKNIPNLNPNPKSAIVVHLDHSFAIDTVVHSLLLTILENNFTVNDSCLFYWFKSHLSNRSVYVSLNYADSTSSTSVYGVPLKL